MSMYTVEYSYKEIAIGKFDLDANATPEERESEALDQIMEESYFDDTNEVRILDIKEMN